MVDARLDELDKIEWLDICRALKPGLTQEEFDGMWARFSEIKDRKKKH